MTDSIDGFSSFLIDTLTSLAILAFVFFAAKQGMGFMSVLNRSTESTSIMREYREFASYDNKDIKYQDAVSLIIQYRGAVSVSLEIGGITRVKWDAMAEGDTIVNDGTTVTIPRKAVSEYSSYAIVQRLSVDKTYKSELVKGGNGEIVEIILHMQ